MKTTFQIFQILNHRNSEQFTLEEKILKPIEHPEFVASYKAINFLTSNNSKLPKGDYVVLPVIKID